MKETVVIALLLFLIKCAAHTEVKCIVPGTNMEYVINPENIDPMENLTIENEKNMKYLTDNLNKRLDDLDRRLGLIIKIGDISSSTFANCLEVLKNTRRSGVYDILVPAISSSIPFQVFCDDDTYYGGWTSIARRLDGSEDFNRGWSSYKEGFGNLRGDFFIGLDKLHAMTIDTKQELLIKLEDINGITKHAKYSEFAIGNEKEGYILKSLGSYAGDAGDGLKNHLGSKFTTKDMDNDQHEEYNCAVEFDGGWWFRKCYESFLFAPYETTSKKYAIIWIPFASKIVNMKFAEMLIRPVPQ